MNGLRICKQFDFFYALQYDMITVHHLNNSRSQRVLWLLEAAMPPLLLKPVFDRVATTPMPWPFSAMARRIAGSVQGAFIRPKLVDFLSRIHGRCAYRRALERGGPYSF